MGSALTELCPTVKLQAFERGIANRSLVTTSVTRIPRFPRIVSACTASPVLTRKISRRLPTTVCVVHAYFLLEGLRNSSSHPSPTWRSSLMPKRFSTFAHLDLPMPGLTAIVPARYSIRFFPGNLTWPRTFRPIFLLRSRDPPKSLFAAWACFNPSLSTCWG